MKVREERGALRIDDEPGLHWLLGLLFIGVGGGFVLGPLGLFVDAAALGWSARVLSAGMGIVVVTAGVWVLGRAPRSRLILDRAAGRVRLVRWGLAGRAADEWPLPMVEGAHVVEGRDDEGGEVFQVHLILRAGRPVPVSPVWHHGRQAIEAVAGRLAAALGVPVKLGTPNKSL